MNYRSLALLAATVCAAAHTHASGYHFGTQSVTSQSTANSSAAEAADASTLFSNPAGLTKLESSEISATVNLVLPSVKASEAEAAYPNGTPVRGSSSDTIASGIKFAPHVYGAYQLNERTTLGLGMYIPFGSETEYEHDSVLRYNINKLGVASIVVEPVIAFKVNEQHAVAVGAIAQHTTAELRQYANFGAFAGANGAADGYSKVKGSDWGYGYHLAWMWDINEQTRMGVNFRSAVRHSLRGTANWELPGAAAQANESMIRGAGYAADESAGVDIVTPESLSVHGMYQADPKWKLFGDVAWTRHSRFDRANLKFGNTKVVAGGTSNETILNPNWRDTYKVGIGAAYQYSEPLQLRFGVAFDQSPVRSAEYRLSTMPDANRLWFSVGAKYDITPKHTVNAAFSHLHINNSRAQVNGYCGGETAASVACVSSKTTGSAEYKSYANIVGLQYNYKF